MNDICENTALRDGKPIPFGGGNDFDDFEYTADQCNEVKLTEPGDCITEVTFYRDNKKYLQGKDGEDDFPIDMGVVGMSFKTTSGSEKVVGQYPSPWQPDIKTKSQYEQNFSEVTYTLGGSAPSGSAILSECTPE